MMIELSKTLPNNTVIKLYHIPQGENILDNESNKHKRIYGPATVIRVWDNGTCRTSVYDYKPNLIMEQLPLGAL